MTNSPKNNSLSHPEIEVNSEIIFDENQKKGSNTHLRLLIYFFLLSLAGSLSYGWYFLTQKLIPAIETPVSNYLGREVQLGEIESISFTSIRLGESQIPTNEKDNDYVIAEGVEITINPFLLLQRQVDLTIKLIRPFGYLQQNDDNSWFSIDIATGERKPFYGFTFQVDEITLDQGYLTLVGLEDIDNPLKAIVDQGNISFAPNNNLYRFQGEIVTGGDFDVTALQKYRENRWLVNVDGVDLFSDDINYLFSLPFDADSGQVSGKIELNFESGRVTDFSGDIDLQDVNFDIPNVPQPLTKSNGNVSFGDGNIYLNQVNTNLGLINGDVEGVIDLDNQLNLQVSTQTVEVQDAIASLNLPPIPLETQGKIEASIDIRGTINRPEIITNVTSAEPILVDKITFSQSQGIFTVIDNRLVVKQFSLTPEIGGEITGKGLVNLEANQSDYFIDWEAKQISAQKLANLYQQEISPDIPPLGFINGEYQLSGLWQEFNQSQLTGITEIDIGTGKATLTNLNYNLDNYQAQGKISAIPLNQIGFIDCQTFGCQESLLEGEFQLSGNSNNINLNTINIVGDFQFPLADNTINLTNTQLSQGKWQTQLIANNLDLQKLTFVDTTTLPIQAGKINTELQISGDIDNVESRKIAGRGNIILPQGLITVDSFALDNQNNFVSGISTKNFKLKDFQASLRGSTTGKLNLRGNINNLNPQAIMMGGNLTFHQGISLIEQPIQTSFEWDGEKILLTQATSQDILARGIINYNIENQTIENFDLALAASRFDIQNLPLPTELDFINYRGKVNFNGKLTGNLNQLKLAGNIDVENLTMANLAFNPLRGKLQADTQNGIKFNLKDVTGGDDKFDLELAADYQPRKIDLQVNQGKLTAVSRNAETLDISVRDISLTPITQILVASLPDNINYLGGNLSGDIALDLNTYDFPSAMFTIKQPRLNQWQGDRMTAAVSLSGGKVTIEEGKLNHLQNEYSFRGEALPFEENPQLRGEVMVTDGNVQDMLTSVGIYSFGDIFEGDLGEDSYGKAQDLYLSEGEAKTFPFQITANNGVRKTNVLRKSETMEEESAFIADDNEIIVSGEESGMREIQSVTPPATGFDGSRGNNEKEINPELVLETERVITNNKTNSNQQSPQPLISISNDNLTLWESIAQWETIEAQSMQEQRDRQQANLPPLEDLDGLFSGGVALNASLREGINLNFDFRGDNWSWGKYRADIVQATGSYRNGVLTILPILIQDNESILSLTGTFRQEGISGQVLLADLPLENLAQVANIPNNLEVDGLVNANLVLSGTRKNPLGRGSVEVVDARVNGTTVEETNATLGYSDSRLDFFARSNLTGEEESASLFGSIPFQLFSESDAPMSDDFSLSLNVEESGFGFIRVITNNQFDLVRGSGGVDLNVSGNYNQATNQITNVITEGVASLAEGEMMVKFIPDTPITNINGEILFDFDQISIPSLTGNLSDGDIIVTGVLPLFDNSTRENRLNVSVDNLALSINSLYQGNAKGIVDIGGSAIAPIFSGNMTLFDGEIRLGGVNGNGNGYENSVNELLNSPFIANTKVDQLRLTLDNNVTVNQPPILSLQARGDLMINGKLADLKPEGVINITGGRVNLFTSQLQVNRNYNNVARFTPENGFNAFLDMQLETKVTETSRYQFVDNTATNEIRDDLNNTVNTIETIRVRANVNGLSDNLNDSLQLTSSPPRNQTEIVSLLGGGFLSNVADGDSGLALANIAGAALFGNIQNLLGDGVTGVEFRLFPTSLINTETRVSSLALGAELGFEVRNNLSLSVLSILTEEQLPLYSVRYRINDRTILRGSTNFNDDSRSAIEFQLRF